MHPKIWVVPFFGQGHILPSVELCKLIASRDLRTTLIIPASLSSSIPSSLHQYYPLVKVAELPASPPPGPPPPPQPGSSDLPPHHHKHHEDMIQALENLISTARSHDPRQSVFAVVDVMMGWTGEIFSKLQVPTIGFFTSGACSAAMEYAMWKYNLEALKLKPGEIRLLPGLPEDMALTDSDLQERPHGPPPGGPPPPGPRGHGPGMGAPPGAGATPPGGGGAGRPGPAGGHPPWLREAGGSVAFMINTCDDLERPFLEYIADQVGKPVWGVGPLLPEQYWKSASSMEVLHDRDVRSNRQSSATEDEVMGWLDSKPRGSVLYVAFGSEVGPTMEEYAHLAGALEASNRPFIWVIQEGSGRPGPPPGSGGREEGYFPHGLDKRVGERGLIIRGWAPQLLILSHPSTGGFLSHCGWNSTVEAIGRGVPILAWPIRGDQLYNAKLIVKHLKVGCMVTSGTMEDTNKDEIVKGIERLMGDAQVKERAAALSAEFDHGFPPSSAASLDAFKDFISSTNQP